MFAAANIARSAPITKSGGFILKHIIAAVLVAALGASAAKAEPAALFNWTGFYVGVDAGALFGRGTNTIPGSIPVPTSAHPNSSGFLYGGHIGYRYQFTTNWVVGVEGQLWSTSGYNASGLYDGGGRERGILDAKHGYAVLGTLGYAINPQLLLYGAGGWSRVHYTGCFIEPNVGPSCYAGSNFSDSVSAFTWGGGIAILLNPNLVLRFQYLHADYGSKTSFTPSLFGNATVADLKTDAITAGLSWKFGN